MPSGWQFDEEKWGEFQNWTTAEVLFLDLAQYIYNVGFLRQSKPFK